MFTNQTNHKSAVGTNAIGQAVTFLFPISETSDIVVKSVVTLTGVETLLAITTNYTVTIAADDGGGTVTMVTAVAATSTIHITRATPMTQELDLVAGGSFNAENIEDALDKTTKLAIDNSKALDFCLRLPDTDSESAELTSFAARAGKFLYFGAGDGAPTVASSVTTGAVVLSAFAEEVVDDADATAMLATLGLTVSAYGKTLIENAAATNARDILGLGDYSATLKTADVISKGPVFDIRAYGADSTGVANSATAIGLAIAAAGASGVIYIPAGTFLVNTSIAVNQSLTVIGDGKCSIIKVGAAVYAFTISVGTNVVFDNFVIDGDSTGSGISATDNMDLLRIHNVTIHDTIGIAIAGTSTKTIGRLEITKCHIKDCVNGANMAGRMTSTYIVGNLIDTITSAGAAYGFWIGSNTYADQDIMRRHIISDNVIVGITTTGVDSEAHAIIAYGKETIIKNNIIHTVTNNATSTSGAEAIYTKCRFANIEGNIITDGGRSSNGAIAAKGSNRGVTASPQGFGINITNNIILESAIVNIVGIFVGRIDDVYIRGNYCEGLSGRAIKVQDGICNNIVIESNSIINHKGSSAIEIEGYGKGRRVNNNYISGLLATEGVITNVFGITILGSAGDLSNVEVCGNYFEDTDETSATTTITGIYIEATDATSRILGLKATGNTFSLLNTTIDARGIYVANIGTEDPAITGFSTIDNDVTGLSGHNAAGTIPLSYYSTTAAETTYRGTIDGSAVWDPASIADGDEEAKEVTVTGAALGDFVLASFSVDIADLVLNAQVTVADTVTCILANNTGGAIDLASGTVYVRVIKK